MASRAETINELLPSFAAAGHVEARKMFGEYAIYCEGRVIAFVCDDELFIKPLPEAKALLPFAENAPPYPGAKDHLRVPREHWQNADLLSEVARTLVPLIAPPKPKKKAAPPRERG